VAAHRGPLPRLLHRRDRRRRPTHRTAATSHANRQANRSRRPPAPDLEADWAELLAHVDQRTQPKPIPASAPTTSPTNALRWPVQRHQSIEDEIRDAWSTGHAAGRVAGRDDALTTITELNATQRKVGRLGYEAQIAGLLALYEECATRQPGSAWRGHYPGGPVDYDTGKLRAPNRPAVQP
jgi:hypothetical protein